MVRSRDFQSRNLGSTPGRRTTKRAYSSTGQSNGLLNRRLLVRSQLGIQNLHIVQSGRTLHLGCRGREFKSLYADIYIAGTNPGGLGSLISSSMVGSILTPATQNSRSSNGRTVDFGSTNRGSSPFREAKKDCINVSKPESLRGNAQDSGPSLQPESSNVFNGVLAVRLTNAQVVELAYTSDLPNFLVDFSIRSKNTFRGASY
jgi:hypothetical protein